MVDNKNYSINYAHLINESMYYIIKMASSQIAYGNGSIIGENGI